MKLRPLFFSARLALCFPCALAGAKITERHSGAAAVQNGDEDLTAMLGALEKTLRRDSYVFVGGSWHRLTSWKTEGCRLTYVITDEGVDVRRLGTQPSVDVKKHTRTKFEFDLSALDPDAVRVGLRRDAASGTLFYRAQGGQNLIRYESDYPKRVRQGSLGWFYLKDRASLEQGAAMLRQAIAACRR